MRKKIARDSLQERAKFLPANRYYTRPHKMKVKPPTFTGEYLRVPAREKPPADLAAATGMPVPPALLSANKQKVTQTLMKIKLAIEVDPAATVNQLLQENYNLIEKIAQNQKIEQSFAELHSFLEELEHQVRAKLHHSQPARETVDS